MPHVAVFPEGQFTVARDKGIYEREEAHANWGKEATGND
jgi:hypothetical protein